MFSINLLWLLWVVVLGWADWDQLFVSQGDPSIVEYVDVTTGQLVLYREGVQAEGAVPLLLHRMYTSAEEKEEAKKIQSNICDLGSGWGLLPHLQLCIDPIGKALFAYTREPSGAFVGYQWTLEKSKQVLFFKSLVSSGARYGLLSGRSTAANHKLDVNIREGKATIHLADGGKRIYEGEGSFWMRTLQELQMPSFSRTLRLMTEILPSGHRICYEYVSDEELMIRTYAPAEETVYAWIQIKREKESISLVTSSGRTYRFCLGKKGRLERVESATAPTEEYYYIKGKKRRLLDHVVVGDQEWLHVTYNETDHVKAIRVFGATTTFSYEPGCVRVTDPLGNVTCYRLNGGLCSIDYADGRKEVFVWDDGFLIAKELYDQEGSLVVRKGFVYDAYKNVIEESVSGNLTGLGWDTYTKSYTYDPETHLLVEEKEEDGPLYRYRYKEGTDLVTHRETYSNGEKVIDEETVYDQNHLVIKRSSSGHTERYVRNQQGLVVEQIGEFDRVAYTYDRHRQVILENHPSYAIRRDYDERGRIIRRTSPLGRENTYAYNARGDLIEAKEVGFPKKTLCYDLAGRATMCKVGTKKTIHEYDLKGRCIKEINKNGDETELVYDTQGRCIRRKLPPVKDGEGYPYRPVIEYSYDAQGYCTSEKIEGEGETRKKYTLFGNPYSIVYPDGAEEKKIYTKHGELAEFDGMRYTYDPLHRLIRREKGGRVATWRYEGILLKEHVNEQGLTTYYTYDRLGRVIAEETGGRKKTFGYDAMNRICRIEEGGLVTEKTYDVEGHVIEESEGGYNRRLSFYDQEGRLVKVVKGDAIDLMAYDEEGRLISHKDPLGNETKISYGPHTREVTDPLGAKSIEEWDALGRCIRKERTGDTHSIDKFLYNRLGKVARRLTHVYNGKMFERHLEVHFFYDAMGRLAREQESWRKETLYAYDQKGRLTETTLPDSTVLHYVYDEWDRITQMWSSDGSIDYTYEYGVWDTPIKVRSPDREFTREYTPFGELAKERGCTWTYDALGRKQELTLPDGSAIHYIYEGPCLQQIERRKPNGDSYSHHYIRFDRNKHVEREIAIDGTYGYTERDLLERPTRLATAHHTEEVTYDKVGLVQQKKSTITGSCSYAYDSLSQLITEGALKHQFNSIGNSKEYHYDELNQITSKGFFYDKNGNMTQQDDHHYRYDALGRLIQADGVNYTYDPWSRLYSREENGQTKYFIYDGDFEIGSYSDDGFCHELRILGLGQNGDVGAAIAIEIDGHPYIPLHNLQGTIIGLGEFYGSIQETYPMNAFGEGDGKIYLNPWRFSSKRTDGHLIYFGHRFYDPHLKRWLSPDPMGFKDSRNLYNYTLNSPLNRLDLYGLDIVFNFDLGGGKSPSFGIGFGTPEHRMNAYTYTLLPKKWEGKGHVNGIPTELIVINNRAKELHIKQEDHESGRINLFDYLDDLIQDTENGVPVFTFTNGINTSKEEWTADSEAIAALCPDNAIFISAYNETGGCLLDLARVVGEKWHKETKSILVTRGIHNDLTSHFEKRDMRGKIVHSAHSEGGLIYNRSFEGMSNTEQKKVRRYVEYNGYGPADKTPKSYAEKAINIFSTGDWITGWYKGRSDDKYEVKWVAAQTPLSQRTMYFADHCFLGKTYQQALQNMMENHRRGYASNDR